MSSTATVFRVATAPARMPVHELFQARNAHERQRRPDRRRAQSWPCPARPHYHAPGSRGPWRAWCPGCPQGRPSHRSVDSSIPPISRGGAATRAPGLGRQADGILASCEDMQFIERLTRSVNARYVIRLRDYLATNGCAWRHQEALYRPPGSPYRMHCGEATDHDRRSSRGQREVTRDHLQAMATFGGYMRACQGKTSLSSTDLHGDPSSAYDPGGYGGPRGEKGGYGSPDITHKKRSPEHARASVRNDARQDDGERPAPAMPRALRDYAAAHHPWWAGLPRCTTDERDHR